MCSHLAKAQASGGTWITDFYLEMIIKGMGMRKFWSYPLVLLLTSCVEAIGEA